MFVWINIYLVLSLRQLQSPIWFNSDISSYKIISYCSTVSWAWGTEASVSSAAISCIVSWQLTSLCNTCSLALLSKLVPAKRLYHQPQSAAATLHRKLVAGRLKPPRPIIALAFISHHTPAVYICRRARVFLEPAFWRWIDTKKTSRCCNTTDILRTEETSGKDGKNILPPISPEMVVRCRKNTRKTEKRQTIFFLEDFSFFLIWVVWNGLDEEPMSVCVSVSVTVPRLRDVHLFLRVSGLWWCKDGEMERSCLTLQTLNKIWPGPRITVSCLLWKAFIFSLASLEVLRNHHYKEHYNFLLKSCWWKIPLLVLI